VNSSEFEIAACALCIRNLKVELWTLFQSRRRSENQLDGLSARVLGLNCGFRKGFPSVAAGHAPPSVHARERVSLSDAPGRTGPLTQGEPLLLSGRRKLLLADDSPTIQKVISLTFEDEGMEVVAVGDGERALEALNAGEPPDILLADVQMPGPNGYELCERVRSDARLHNVPVVLLVGKFEPFNEAEARRVGADTFLTKPFQSIRDLVGKVGSLLGSKKREGAAAEEQRRGAPAPQDDARHEPVAQTAEYDIAEVEGAQFADFSADDELIEAKPADSFVPSSHAEAAAEFNTLGQSSDEAHFDSHVMLDHEAPTEAHADTHAAQETQTPSPELAPAASAAPVEAGERVMAAHASFSARAAGSASADDALLDLGQFAPPAPSSAAEADDFVLDLEDDFALDVQPGEADAPSAFAEAAHGGSASAYEEAPQTREWAYSEAPHEEATPAGHVEPEFEPTQFGFSAQHDAAHESGVGARGFVEPEVVAADAPAPASVGGEYADGSVEGDVPRPPAVSYDTNPTLESARQPAHDVSALESGAQEQAASEPSAAGYTVGEARVGVEETSHVNQLSPEDVERIARRVVELMSESVVREVAWEVVPELAELLIKQRLEEGRQK
jgi:CheY-like chemotaxis protein